MKYITKYRYLIRIRNLIKEGIQQISYSYSQFEKEFPFELMRPGQEEDFLKQYEDFFKKVEHIDLEFKEVKKQMEKDNKLETSKNGN